MPTTESTIPNDWFMLGDQDLQAAEILIGIFTPPDRRSLEADLVMVQDLVRLIRQKFGMV